MSAKKAQIYLVHGLPIFDTASVLSLLHMSQAAKST